MSFILSGAEGPPPPAQSWLLRWSSSHPSSSTRPSIYHFQEHQTHTDRESEEEGKAEKLHWLITPSSEFYLRSQSSIEEAATMWRRLASSYLKTLAVAGASSVSRRPAPSPSRFIIDRSFASPSPASASLLAHRTFSSEAGASPLCLCAAQILWMLRFDFTLISTFVCHYCYVFCISGYYVKNREIEAGRFEFGFLPNCLFTSCFSFFNCCFSSITILVAMVFHDTVWKLLIILAFYSERGRSILSLCFWFSFLLHDDCKSHGSVCSIEAATALKKKVEDVMPIATGHEREELEAELEVILYPRIFVFVWTVIFYFTHFLYLSICRRALIM